MDVRLHCEVCGADYQADDVEPHVNLGVIQQWRDAHQHSAGELKMYHDANVEVRQYEHTHKHGEIEDDE